MKENISEIIKKIQRMQNEYQKYKKIGDSLGMLCIMWEIGDYLRKIGVKNPHSLGWKIQAERAYIKRPMIFRSYKIRSVWKSKEQLKKDSYGVKSVNSVVEMFPFLDQNDKWKLPKEEFDKLMKILNTRSSREFNRILLQVKSKYIGVKYDKDRHLSELKKLKKDFYSFYKNFKNLLGRGSVTNCKNFRDSIGKDNLKNFGTLCLYLGTEKDFDVKVFEFKKSRNEDFNKLFEEMIEKCKSQEKRKRIRRVIQAIDLVNMTDFCNSILSESSIIGYRSRKNLDLKWK